MIRIKLTTWPGPETATDPAIKKNSKRWSSWREDCKKMLAEICSKVEGGMDPADVSVTSLYARKSIKRVYFMDKDGPFRGKCAYCEAYITDNQRGDVEHFRPKGKVTDASDKDVLVTDRNERTRAHWGYYWLAYATKNLMPSCQLCNQPVSGGLGKRTRFPLEDESTRARYHDDDIAKEKPLLINPLVEDPSKHLKVDTVTGFMVAKTQRGQACIDILGLNRRDQLVAARRTAIQKIQYLWQRPGENSAELEKLLVDAAEPHTLASRTAYKKLVDSLPPVAF